jgi:Family of unknown function (DUF6328)
MGRQPPRSDQAWDTDQRHETSTERLDRNWTELLQELRVVQTGVQFLTGFLLTLPLQQRFTTLSTDERVIYLCAVGFAVGSTAAVIAPVALHRVLFRQHARPELVSLAHRLALVGYWCLAAAITAVVLLIFLVVEGRDAGIAAASVTFVMLVALWGALPAWALRHVPRAQRGADSNG